MEPAIGILKQVVQIEQAVKEEELRGKNIVEILIQNTQFWDALHL